MKRAVPFALAVLLLGGTCVIAQSQPPASSSSSSTPSSSSSSKQKSVPASQDPDDILNSPMTPPRSDDAAHKGSDKTSTDEEFPFPESEEKPGSYSSSKDTRGDISPPAGDANHPGGDITIAPSDGVMEMKPWDPHEADKDVEVGTFYFKRGNYKGAEARFRDALHWQNNHAEANYRLGETLEKEGKVAEARGYYEAYLKILPRGEFAADSRKALERINAGEDGKRSPAKKASISPPL